MNDEEKNKNNPENIENESGMNLGDTVKIVGGRYDGYIGKIYYSDETQISILPEGASDHVLKLEVEDGYLR